MHPPRNEHELLALIDDLLFETGELMACAEEEGADAIIPLCEEIGAQLRQLSAAVRDGQAPIGQGEELAFMPLLKQMSGRLPFGAELEVLNFCYKRGYESE